MLVAVCNLSTLLEVLRVDDGGIVSDTGFRGGAGMIRFGVDGGEVELDPGADMPATGAMYISVFTCR